MLWWHLLQMRMGGLQARLKAIEQIGLTGDGSAVDPLIGVAGEALRDRNVELQEAVARALAAIAHPYGLPALLAFLQSGTHPTVQEVAILGMKRIKDPLVIDPLVLALKETGTVRKAAIDALASFGASATTPLLAALCHKEKEVRAGATEAMAAMGAIAVPALMAALRDKVVDLRAAAAMVLLQIKEPAIEPLIKTLNSPDEHCRETAAEILGQLGAKAALEPLIELLHDPSVGVRIQAMKALEALQWEPRDTEERALCAVVRGDWDEVVKIGAPTIPHLIADLKDPDLEVRKAITTTLVTIGKPAVEPLIKALKAEDAQTRFHAALALGEIGDGHAVDALAAAIKDPDATVRDTAVGALSKFKGPQVIEGMIAALKDEDPLIRSRAARALGDLNDNRAVEPLLEAAKDEGTRSAAAFALWRLAPTKAIKPLAMLATQEASSEEAIVALSQLLQSAADRLAVDDLQAIADIHQSKPAEADPDVPARPALVKRSADPTQLSEMAREELRRRGVAV